MNAIDRALLQELESWESAGLGRSLARREPVAREREFTSNDYLGLAGDPELIEAAREALSAYGAGGRASRLLGGGSPLDDELEETVAGWLGAEAALLFPTGYQANLGVIGALAGPRDIVLSDELNHASLIDAVRLARTRVGVFRHNDLDELARRLARAQGARRRIIVVESIYSMDGDRAPLAELNQLAEEHDAWLVVDEAHAVGLLGPEGAGAWAEEERAGADPSRLAARIVTGGKALGVTGALVAGPRALREELLNRARSFVYTTGVAPAVSGALLAAVRRVRADRTPAERALSVAREIAARLELPTPAAAIVPFVVGDSQDTLELANKLEGHGLDVRAVRPPTVPHGTARLRIACHAYNDAGIEPLVGALSGAVRSSYDPAPLSSARPTCVVVGTDTGIGKTVVSALLVRAAGLRCGPQRARYWKPVQTGDDSDTRTVRELSLDLQPALEEPLYEFPLPASPHEAAADAGARIDPERIHERLAELRRPAAPDAASAPNASAPELMIVELAGGLLVPYDDRTVQADFLARERLNTVLVARSGLGTLNHTLLTVEAMAARHLVPKALFLVGPPHVSNRATLAERTGIEHVFELPELDPLDAAALDRWLEHNDLTTLLEDV